MINTAFKQRNASQQNYSGRMRMPLDLLPRTTRDWTLTLWELKGEPETWGKQLADYYQREPVFAVVSGVSGSTWAPVDQFCQQTKVPCLFPSVTHPPKEASYYSLYYSKGTALEAAVVGKYLTGLGASAPKRVIEIYRDEPAGTSADAAIQTALKTSDMTVEKRLYDGSEGSAQAALADLSANDAVVIWLGTDDLATLQRLQSKPPVSTLFVSGTLINDQFSSIDKAWQKQVNVMYPYEIGQTRETNSRALKSWLATWKLPLVDELMQTEVFFNLLFLTDLSSQMLDNLYRDYLIERAEDM
jgi:ABC-type branched-subunit amino acid transport system substrate-binding protein